MVPGIEEEPPAPPPDGKFEVMLEILPNLESRVEGSKCSRVDPPRFLSTEGYPFDLIERPRWWGWGAYDSVLEESVACCEGDALEGLSASEYTVSDGMRVGTLSA